MTKIKIIFYLFTFSFIAASNSIAVEKIDCTEKKGVSKVVCKTKSALSKGTSKVNSATEGITSKKSLADFFKKKE